jgi:hypothetical protein
MFLATGDDNIPAKYLRMFDPASPAVIRWGWWRLFESYGCAIRSYAFADKIHPELKGKLDKNLQKKCIEQLLMAGADQRKYSQSNAYDTSFPLAAKKARVASYYFPIAGTFDTTVAYLLEPKADLLDSIVGNINYEGGSNPINVTFLTGLGWHRQHEIVSAYANNDRRALPPSGIPLGSIQAGFSYLQPYKSELGALSYPQDGDNTNPYAFYDRWGDSWNLSTEFVSVMQARSLASLAMFMASQPLRNQKWKYAQGKIVGIANQVKANTTVTANLKVDGLDLSKARIVWEGQEVAPVFGATTITFTPQQVGSSWLEVEAQLPDGRRVFASIDFQVGN